MRLFRPRASWEDYYNRLSYSQYKTALEILKELEGEGFRVTGMRGVMYVHLMQWQEEGHVQSRIRPKTADTDVLRREYRAIPGARKKRSDVGELELSVQLA
jgi:hypothetical protein